MNREAWQTTVHRVTKSWTLSKRLHFHFSLSCIGEGNGNPLQCSSLENPRDGGAWWAAIYGVAQSRTRLKRLSSSIYIYTHTHTHTHTHISMFNKFKGKITAIYVYTIVTYSGERNTTHSRILKNPVERGAWWAAVHGVTQSWTRHAT